MPLNTASSLPSSRISPSRVSPPHISPPRISPPQLNVNRVCSANHDRLPEEAMIKVKRAIPVTKVSPPSPSPKRQSPAPTIDSENVQEQAPPSPVVEHVVLPRNTGVVFDRHLAPRDENVPAREGRPRNATGKNKVKFSVSYLSVSTGTSTSEPEDDIDGPFAPPVRMKPAPIPQQPESCLTVSLRENGIHMASNSTSDTMTDPATTSSRSTAPDQSMSRGPSTSTARTTASGAPSFFLDPDGKRSGYSSLGPRPFQRVPDKRYFDEPPPTKSCRPDPVPPPPKPVAKPLFPEGSIPGLTPSSVAIPNAGRAPHRPAVDRPPLDRPAQQPKKAKAPPRADLPRRNPELPREVGVIRKHEGACWASEACQHPQLKSAGSTYCRFHTCCAILVDGHQCVNRVIKPTWNEEVPAYCGKGYHKETGTFDQLDIDQRLGIIRGGRLKLQEESDRQWYAKVLAIVHPEEEPDIRLTPELFEELFDPDTDDEDSEPASERTLQYRKRKNYALTGIVHDTSVRPVRKFLTLNHIMAHPKLKKPPQVILTADQKAEFLRAAEGTRLPPRVKEAPKVAPKLMYTLPPPFPFKDSLPNPRPPGWIAAFGLK